jgi:AsmA protein
MEFSGKVDESNVRGNAAVTRYSPLAVTFDLDADRLDADRLMGRASAASKPAPQAAPAGKPASATPAAQAQTAQSQTSGARPASGAGEDDADRIDLSALEGLDASGRIRIGQLRLLDLDSSQVQASVKLARGRLEVAPISAQLYQGTLEGSLSAQTAANPLFSVRQTLSGVALGPLLRDAAQIDTLEGKGTVRADLNARGATVQALKKALNGTASVRITDGAVKGIDIAGTIRSVRAKIGELRGKPVQSSNKSEKTDFSELTASFKVTNGVAHNDDLSMKSPLLRVQGAGDIDIGENRMNYGLKATLVGTTKGQGGRDVADLAGVTVPVQLTGALDSPQWSIDFAGVAAGLAEKKLNDEILKRIPGGSEQPDGKRGIEDAIKDRLKGLLNR